MKLKSEEIVAYAERQIEARNKNRWLVPAFGAGILVCGFLVVKMLLEKGNQVGESLFANERFLMGFAFAILFILTMGVGAAMFATLVRRFGIETDVCELLVKLWKERSGQQATPPYSEPATRSPRG